MIQPHPPLSKICQAILLLFAVLTFSGGAIASKRVALVIGNSDYESLNDLANPKADARAVAERLKGIGFSLIGQTSQKDGAAALNLTQKTFYQTLYRFAEAAKGAEIALVYYAGHGMQLQGQPYVLPTNVEPPKKKYELDLLYKSAIGIDEILRLVDEKADLTIAVFDACREIPDIDKLTRSSGLSSEGYRGLGRVSSSGKNRIIAYSGASGELVADGNGSNSPYTTMLLAHLNESGMDVPQVFQTVAYQFSQHYQGQNPELLIQGVPPNKYYLLAGGSIQPNPISARNPVTGKGDLIISTRPVGATLFLEGGYLGQSPQTVKGLTAEQGYSVEARLNGYETTREKVTIKAGKQHKITLQLDQSGTHLTVNTTPSQARVRIMNIDPPYEPGMKLEAGSYRIEVSASGYETVDKWIQVSGGNHEETVVLEQARQNDLATQLGLKFVDIPAGSFQMGSKEGEGDSDEHPDHRVSLSAFKMMKYEVSKGQFKQFVNASGYKTDAEKNAGGNEGCYVESTFGNGKWGWQSWANWKNVEYSPKDNHPVVCISHNDAKAFAEWLSRETGLHYRLPAEAEWEYAAKAGSTTKYSFGNSENGLCDYGNGADKSAKRKYSEWTANENCDDGYVYSAPIGSFKPNAFGLYDMHGNVWEWTQDCWSDSYSGAPKDGSAWESGDCSVRVLRGGSWGDWPSRLRSAFRNGNSADNRDNNGGFRLVQGR